jgi:hypothetical protein
MPEEEARIVREKTLGVARSEELKRHSRNASKLEK